MRFPEYANVQTRGDLINLIFALLDHNDAVEWKNDTAYGLLQAMAQWLNDSTAQVPTWQLFADMLNTVANEDAPPTDI